MQKDKQYTSLETEEFIPVGEKLIADKKDFIAIFSGSEDAQGANWCSDCVVAKPNILSVLIPAAVEKKIPVYYVSVGDKPVWKNPQHPLRIHPQYKLDGVPTAIIFTSGAPGPRLKEDDFLSTDLIEEIFE